MSSVIRSPEVGTGSLRDLEPESNEGYLEVMPASGGQPRVVFRGPWGRSSASAGIAWSPDQRYLLFVRGVPSASDGVDVSIWRVPLSGGEAENTGITIAGAANDSALTFPSVHPDGHRIVYTRKDPSGEVRAMENFLAKTSAG